MIFGGAFSLTKVFTDIIINFVLTQTYVCSKSIQYNFGRFSIAFAAIPIREGFFIREQATAFSLAAEAKNNVFA
jgi:hypothetical protein